jgi:hypothetical protein
MEERAAPQFSRDGRWWWNGYYWVAVERRQGAIEVALDGVRRSTAPVPWLGLVALTVLLVLALLPAAVGWARQAGLAPSLGAPAAPAAPAVPATPAPAVPATAAPEPAAGTGTVDAYLRMVRADIGAFQASSQAVGDRCALATLPSGAGDCRAALQVMDAAVARFQADLDAQPAPACLRAGDAELRTALGLYRQGIGQEQSGLDRDEAAALLQGAGTMARATDHLRSAGTLLSRAC